VHRLATGRPNLRNVELDRFELGLNKAGRIWGDGMSPKVLWDRSTLLVGAAVQAG
jgi:hypothetical protein